MNKILMVIFMFGFIGQWSSGPTGKLVITIENVSPGIGEIFVAVYDHPDSYLNEELAVFKKIIKATDSVQSIGFHDVPTGYYAIAVYQDLNSNGKLDTKTFGIPKEPFGFSNNARGRFGPPKFDATKFNFSGNMEIEIELFNNAKK